MAETGWMFESSGTTHHSPQVTGYMRQLEQVDQGDYVELTALQAFLATHRHGATLPEVRWRIRQSLHAQLMGELRTADPFPPYRVLFAMPKDESWLVFLVAGNKGDGNHRGNGWYDAWVPVADALLNQFLATR